MSKNPKYRFSPSLLDKFIRLESAEKIYENSNAESLEEVRERLRKELLDTINKVKGEPSKAMLKGIAFENLCDLIAGNKKWTAEDDDSISLCGEDEAWFYEVMKDGHLFKFDYQAVQYVSSLIQDALTQQFVEGTISTCFGGVRLIGYVDALIRNIVKDIKCTGIYNFGKFEKSMQRYVYPYCLEQMGCKVDFMEFIIHTNDHVYVETYLHDSIVAESNIIEVCERFIDFIESNKELITDRRIFNESK